MKFNLATIFVQNMEQSLHFYGEVLGLPVQARQQNGEMELAFLGEPGQAQVELIYQPGAPPQSYAGFSLGFAVPSLDAAMAQMQELHIPILRGPIAPSPAVRFCFVQDPNGVEIELLEYAN